MSAGYLEKILDHKKAELANAKSGRSIDQLRNSPLYGRLTFSLRAALRASTPGVIAEVKKASPSKGVIRADFDHRAVAREYARAGAAAISVLTDEHFFQGSLSYLEDIRKEVDLPLLRKDFIIDSFQLHEARAAGADAVLLIAAALELAQMKDLRWEAAEMGLECLIEVHTAEEIESLDVEFSDIVGINNRNLQTFETDLSVSRRLRSLLPGHVTVVSESGIRTAHDIRTLVRSGIDAVLIGETLMRAPSPGKALSLLLAEVTDAKN